MPVQNLSTIEEKSVYEETVFASVDRSTSSIAETEFLSCIFKNCHFNDSSVIKCTFDTCTFEHCNFNMCKLTDTAMKTCIFNNCTFVGVDFTKMRTSFAFEPKFSDCNVSFATFSGIKMPKSGFITCKLEETDFSEAKLDESLFHFSDLTRAIFNHSDLRETDFRGALNYVIDPRNNFLKEAVFSEPDVMSLLDALDIKIAEPPEEGDA